VANAPGASGDRVPESCGSVAADGAPSASSATSKSAATLVAPAGRPRVDREAGVEGRGRERVVASGGDGFEIEWFEVAGRRARDLGGELRVGLDEPLGPVARGHRVARLAREGQELLQRDHVAGVEFRRPREGVARRARVADVEQGLAEDHVSRQVPRVHGELRTRERHGGPRVARSAQRARERREVPARVPLELAAQLVEPCGVDHPGGGAAGNAAERSGGRADVRRGGRPANGAATYSAPVGGVNATRSRARGRSVEQTCR
jgi:hypothetical protein